MKDPESGKMKEKVSGLGRWRCSGCRKACKVTRHAPAAKATDTKALQATVAAAPNTEARNAIIDAVVATGEVPSAPTKS
jgi:transposase-like protein